MTQHQIAPPAPLPACQAAHPPRLMRDLRCADAGGGLFIECPCGATKKHAEFDAALQEWKRIHRIRTPRQPRQPDNVIQFGLFSSGGRR